MHATASKCVSEPKVEAVIEIPRVLVVDDDAELRELVAECLRDEGTEVVLAASGNEAFEVIGSALRAESPRYFDLVITDLQMADGCGLDLLRALRFTDYAVPVVLLSGMVDQATRRRARKLGATVILPKPFEPDQLRAIVVEATRRPWWHGR